MSVFLEGLLARAKGLLGQPKPTGTQTVAVRHDRWDHEDWEDVRAQSGALQDTLTDLGETFDYTEDLAEGMFDYFTKVEPQIVDGAEMLDSRRPNQKITLQGSETPEVTELRQYTKGDPFTAAMAVVGVSEKLRNYLQHNKELAEAAKEAEQKRKEREEAEQAAIDAAAQAQQAQDDYDGEGPQTEEQAAAAQALADALDSLEQAQQGQQQASEALDQAMNEAASGTRHAVREGIREAAEEAAEQAACAAAAGVDPGDAKYMSFEEREQLAQALRESRLPEMAKLIGRFRMEARAEWAKATEHGRDVFVEVELGDDIGRALGSELAKMSSGAPRGLRLDTLRRMGEKRLLLKKYEGTEKSGKGAICAVVDTSGSMGANIGGTPPSDVNLDPTREAWAKAITFVLLDSARRQKRDFYAILFSSAGQQRHYSFPHGGDPVVLTPDGKPIPVATPVPGNQELAVTIDLISFMYGGGTNFEQPLKQAVQVIERKFDSDGKAKADIVFITDDDGTVSPAFMEDYQRAKDKVGIRTFGFAVGCHAGMTLNSVCDSPATSLTDLASTDEAKHVFRQV